MRDQLRALVRLAEIDDSARELEQELEELPARVEEMRADVDRLSAMLDREREELREAADLKTAQEQQMAESSELLARAKAKGAKARNAREADAAEREMEAVRRSLREREDEVLKLAEAMENKEASLGEREAKLEEFRNLFKEEEAQAQARLEEVRAEKAKVTAGREEVIQKLPRPIVSRYERLRTKIGNVVVEVVDGTCMGCRLQIPPQQFNTLHRAEDVEQCPHCLRMIFVRSVIED